jgi:hypothetical protein
MLSDGGDEFLGGKDLEVLLVAPVGHAGAIDDRAGVLDSGNLLLGEGIPHLHQALDTRGAVIGIACFLFTRTEGQYTEIFLISIH